MGGGGQLGAHTSLTYPRHMPIALPEPPPLTGSGVQGQQIIVFLNNAFHCVCVCGGVFSSVRLPFSLVLLCRAGTSVTQDAGDVNRGL